MGRLYAIRWLLLWLLPFLIIPSALAENQHRSTYGSDSQETSTKSLSVSPTSLQLSVGQRATVKVSNAVGTVKAIVASATIASASVSGSSVTVTGKSAGTTTLSIYDSRNTPVKVSVTVTKTGTTAALSVSPTTLSLAPGQSAAVAISNASGTVSFSMANTSIATATLSGSTLTVTGKSAGTTTLSVVDSRNTAVKVSVTVVGSIPVAVLSASPMAVSLTPGQSASVSILNASGTLSASVANTSIAKATLSGSTLTVTGVSAGSTQVVVNDSKYSVTISVTVSATQASTGSYTLLAWNDLGMHCMDGKDYSVFSILPPYNNLHAQLIDTANNKLVTSGVILTYESMADPAGSINTISSTKTNFWQYVQKLFGLNPAPDVGLTGNKVSSLTPNPMVYNTTEKWFEATAIPMTPYDDTMAKNYYPMVKVVAKDSSGNVLAQARVVLPVSDEMSCASCHASNSTSTAAKPKAGWVNDPNLEIDWKKNILLLHDEKQALDANYQSALKTLNYSSSGLMATVNAGTPVLCASCHSSNALGTAGAAGVEPLTQAIHSHHASVIDPATGTTMDSVTNRDSCYQCHPGSQTKCLRGVMGNAVDANGNMTIQCQSCHGVMSNVGKAGRVGWLNEPNCQACHHDSVRELSAVDTSGNLKSWLDATFATNANVPQAPYSLYRFSAGHGGLQCEACHGATHAEYPSSHVNDNLLANDVQGHSGTIAECVSCHKTVPTTNNGGPHGMHTVGQAWVKSHESYAKSNKTTCAYCHGADYRGSPLSELKVSRTFTVENGTKTFAAGHQMNCYDCHNGPNGG
jgi:hypothetical protein